METNCKNMDLVMICAIVNSGLGSNVLKTAKKHGVMGGTIFLGRGTINNPILNLLSLSDTKKEIVLMITSRITAANSIVAINKELKINKPNHGIVFTISVRYALGSSSCITNDTLEGREEITMHQAIFVIVEKGNAELVIEAASKVGAKGGTIMNARGSGIHETSKLFHLDIEPEKEIVLILSEASLTKEITSTINELLNISKPGNGILFVQDVDNAYGLF
ncbi:MAG TPA: P-II family nitrogen regulator [Lachnospiraceae bacterium]|nr:P-II family nitrogen regulator [Lachnospiraceae bacterium]